ncbi:MAG: biotin/lipoyl-binding protein, partial [Prochlorococcaceae cyanobacterium]
MASPLSPLDPRGSDPAALAVADAGEFLPDPGGWTRHLGWRALAAAGGCLAALWFWPMGETVRAPGVVRPSGENSVVQSSLPGRLASVAVKPDQVVAAGQVLARLDTAALADERRQRLAENALLDQQLGQARSARPALLLGGATGRQQGPLQAPLAGQLIQQSLALAPGRGQLLIEPGQLRPPLAAVIRKGGGVEPGEHL